MQSRDEDGNRLMRSMDDPMVYGPLLYKLSYAAALRAGIIKRIEVGGYSRQAPQATPFAESIPNTCRPLINRSRLRVLPRTIPVEHAT